MAAIDIRNGSVIEGELPAKAVELVREWIELHKEELLHIWNTQEFKQLAPLE